MADHTVEERLLRRPHLRAEHTTRDPLTVVCSLLSRADNTPLGDRSRGEKNVLDHAENVIANPALDPSQNAFEGNPNLNFEHWGEYWRKVHGVRFTYEEDPEDRSFSRLLRYEQLHRFAPGPTGHYAPPYFAPVDQDGKLWPTVIGHIEPYQRPRWDGIAYLSFKSREDIGQVFSSPRIASKIMPEDFAMFRDLAPILARQHIIVPTGQASEAVTFVKLHRAARGVSRAEFQDWWLETHGPRVASNALGLIRRYVQLHSIGPTEPGQPFFHEQTKDIDGVTLMSFGTVNELEDYLRSYEYAAIAEDEVQWTNPDGAESWTSIGMVIVNRLGPEKVTRIAD